MLFFVLIRINYRSFSLLLLLLAVVWVIRDIGGKGGIGERGMYFMGEGVGVYGLSVSVSVLESKVESNIGKGLEGVIFKVSFTVSFRGS